MGAIGTKIKAQTSCCLFTKRGLSIPTKSNKQQETYADMTTHYALKQA